MKHKKNKYVDILKEVNLRPTRQRVVLVSNIFNSGNRHINAEKLHEEVLFSGEKVSLATVYNTLNNLTNAGLLRQVKVNSKQNYFDTNTSSHHTHALFKLITRDPLIFEGFHSNSLFDILNMFII